MNSVELRNKYIEFFKSKGHKEIHSSSLIPENDPTVLFTTAGMHPLVPFLLGQKHPLGKRLVGIQKCLRTVDIDSVGDSYHHTFFEMLGNWSLGDYFKKEAIEYSYEFATKILKLNKEKLAVTVFAGNKNALKDTEAEKIWSNLGFAKERIVFLESNWWEIGGDSGPCGPCTEMFYWKNNSKPTPKVFDPEDSDWVEIWNDVLMEYEKVNGKYQIAKQKNIDNGRGLERVLAVINGFDDNYLTDLWQPIIEKIEQLTEKSYKDYKREMRLIADHVKASVFLISDGVIPSNLGQGYILRRLIRRAIRNIYKLEVREKILSDIAAPVFEIYDKIYSELKKNKEKIIIELKKEEDKFLKTLEEGLTKFANLTKNSKELSGKDAFLLFQSYGFPIEMTEELTMERGIKINIIDFNKEYEKHQELSRTASAGTFKSGLADNSEETTKLHTAAHLLLAAINKVIQQSIIQKGSNITAERLRLDFNLDRKLTSEEIVKIENQVNEWIKQKIPVVSEELSLEEAKKLGAQGVFEHKYGDKVSVYTIGTASKEICTGPHVKNTRELKHFKIQKEESVASGIRRIKAVLN
jgi:alanyl-tRNA synthetase